MSTYALVQAGFGGPRRQSRWKVAFRLILAIPLLVWYVLISIAAGFLVVIGWFCALVLGRLPRRFVEPLSEYIVFVTRTNSYLYLMNDAYPPFSVKKEFGVNVEIPSSDVRRLAVLFRIILVIPVAVVSALLTVGTEVAAVFIWLIVLVKGEMPISLFGALAASLKYQARFFSYYMMITAKYPGELFGDSPSAPTDTSTTSATGIPFAAPLVEQTAHLGMVEAAADSGEPPLPGAEAPRTQPDLMVTPGPPTGAPTLFPSDMSPMDLESPPRTARLVLSKGSKNILVLLLVLGAVGNVTSRVLQIRLLDNQSALAKVIVANNALNSEILVAKSQKASCSNAADVCIHQYFVTAANDFNTFEVAIANISYPSGTRADALQFERTSSKFVAVLDQMKSGPATPGELNALQTLGTDFDTQFHQVISDLTSPI